VFQEWLQFAFLPIYTTDEYRELPYGKLISMLLELKKVLIVAKGETV
jgi:hypothetical protein